MKFCLDPRRTRGEEKIALIMEYSLSIAYWICEMLQEVEDHHYVIKKYENLYS